MTLSNTYWHVQSLLNWSETKAFAIFTILFLCYNFYFSFFSIAHRNQDIFPICTPTIDTIVSDTILVFLKNTKKSQSDWMKFNQVWTRPAGESKTMNTFIYLYRPSCHPYSSLTERFLYCYQGFLPIFQFGWIWLQTRFPSLELVMAVGYLATRLPQGHRWARRQDLLSGVTWRAPHVTAGASYTPSCQAANLSAAGPHFQISIWYIFLSTGGTIFSC